MPSYTVASGALAAHDKTLTAATVDTVTFTDATSVVEILSDGAARLYVTVDGTTPAVSGANTDLLVAGIASGVRISTTGNIVKLISSGTPTYSVRRVQ